jgi:hypothetical protein
MSTPTNEPHPQLEEIKKRPSIYRENKGNLPRTANLSSSNPLRHRRQSTSLITRRTLSGTIIAIGFPALRRTVVAIRAINALYQIR